ncbi:MAG: hypothetical protein ACRDKH_02140 [Solirubrobacterales bacterium]
MAALGAAVILLAFPASSAAVPALDEYTFDPPDAEGKRQNVERAPAPGGGSLDPAVARELARSPNGQTLATIATSPELGAPPPPVGGSSVAGTTAGAGSDVDGDDPTLLSAAADGLGDSAMLGVLGGLLGVAALFFLARRGLSRR